MPNLTPKYVYIGIAVAIVLLAVSFTAGRYLAPTKTVTVEKKVVDETAIQAAIAVAKAEWQKTIQDHTRIVTVYKDGKVIEKTVYKDVDTAASGTSNNTSNSASQTEKHETDTNKTATTRAEPVLILSAGPMIDLKPKNFAPMIEATVDWFPIRPLPVAAELSGSYRPATGEYTITAGIKGSIGF
jgi:hypothetical protein